MRKVMVFGSFDGLHEGHRFMLSQAKIFGDFLSVVVARDSTMERTKGQCPTQGEEQRVEALRAVEGVDEVLLGDPFDPYRIIEQQKPDVIALGYDQRSFDANLAFELHRRGCAHTEIVRIPSYRKNAKKSSIEDPRKFMGRFVRSLEELRERGYVKHCSSLLLGISGGPDSVALLTALTRLPSPWSLSLHVCHVNYGLRGEEAEADERFVRALAERLRVPCSVKRVHDAPHDERALRDMRYDFFEAERARLGFDAITVAHTYDDQVETVLLRLLRGTGLKGLSAMSVRSGRIFRPFLTIRRSELAAYLEHLEQDFRTDSSNLDTAYARNRVRHELLPLLRSTYNENIDERLYETARIAADDYAYIRAQAECVFALTVTAQEPRRVTLSYEKWRALPLALQRELLRIAIERVRGDVEGVSLAHLEEAREMLSNRRAGGEKMYFGNLRIREEYDKIVVYSED